MKFFFITCSNFVKEFLFLKRIIRLLNSKITAEDTFLQSEFKKIYIFKSNDIDPKEKKKLYFLKVVVTDLAICLS